MATKSTAPISLEDDEEFIANIKSKTQTNAKFFIYGLLFLIVSIIFVSKQPVHNSFILSWFTIMGIYGVLSAIFAGWQFFTTRGSSYFFTTKRLYIKQAESEEYQPFTYTEIKSIYHKNRFLTRPGNNLGLLIELHNGNVIHMSSVLHSKSVRRKLIELSAL